MDVHCATCGEPWDTYHLRHDEIYEVVNLGAMSESEAKAWDGTLRDWLRAAFTQLGWEFGATVTAVKHCPACKHNGLRPDAAERREKVQVLSDLMPDDPDGVASMQDDLTTE